MNIPLKISDRRWIPYQDAELLIDYLTVDQQEEMEILRYEIEDKIFELQELSAKVADALKKKKPSAKLSKEFDYKVRNPKVLSFFRAYISCAIKDWRGIINAETKEPIPCELENDRLSKNSLWLLTSMPYDAVTLYSLILAEIEFTSSDKKKSNSANS